MKFVERDDEIFYVFFGTNLSSFCVRLSGTFNNGPLMGTRFLKECSKVISTPFSADVCFLILPATTTSKCQVLLCTNTYRGARKIHSNFLIYLHVPTSFCPFFLFIFFIQLLTNFCSQKTMFLLKEFRRNKITFVS